MSDVIFFPDVGYRTRRKVCELVILHTYHVFQRHLGILLLLYYLHFYKALRDNRFVVLYEKRENKYISCNGLRKIFYYNTFIPYKYSIIE